MDFRLNESWYRCRSQLAVKIWSEHVRGGGANGFVVALGLEFGKSDKWVLVTGCDYLFDDFRGSAITCADWATCALGSLSWFP